MPFFPFTESVDPWDDPERGLLGGGEYGTVGAGVDIINSLRQQAAQRGEARTEPEALEESSQQVTMPSPLLFFEDTNPEVKNYYPILPGAEILPELRPLPEESSPQMPQPQLPQVPQQPQTPQIPQPSLTPDTSPKIPDDTNPFKNFQVPQQPQKPIPSPAPAPLLPRREQGPQRSPFYDLVSYQEPSPTDRDTVRAAMLNEATPTKKREIPLVRQTATPPFGSPELETMFQNWYRETYPDLNPNPDDPLHHYDYRALFLAGGRPESSEGYKEPHSPSEFKLATHPERYVYDRGQLIDSITGIPEPVRSPYQNYQQSISPATEFFFGQLPAQYLDIPSVEEGFKMMPVAEGMRPAGKWIEREGEPTISEYSATIVGNPNINQGNWTNIPTAFNGKLFTPEQAERIIADNKGIDPDTGRELPGYATEEEAISNAKIRSRSFNILRRYEEKLRDVFPRLERVWEYPIPEEVQESLNK